MHVAGLAMEDNVGHGAGLTALWVWCYCIIWWWVQDGCKVLTYSVC
eukprot:COSAG06_NODE_46833_length_344_cov_0.477551_2_plen_45_part_01